MPEQFTHLHVASSYSLRFGASHPDALVERAAEHGMDSLALTDRDGVYGAVRFVNACQRAGISPILGADLAVHETGSAPFGSTVGGTPAKGGRIRDQRFPRVTFLASSSRGWAALCRLISAAHAQAAVNQGQPVCTPELLTKYLPGSDLLVLLGPASALGRLVTQHRYDLATDCLNWWRGLAADRLLVELVSHRLAGTGPASGAHAARMAGLAQRLQLPTVLTNAVRHGHRGAAPTVDILDASRRLVPLDPRHLDRSNAEGYLKSGAQMRRLAEEICSAAGLDANAALRLLTRTRAVAEQCVIDPVADLGIGRVHFPEFEIAGQPSTRSAALALRDKCEAAIPDRYGNGPRQRVWKRLDDELQLIDSLGYASYFLAVAEVTGIIKELGIRSAARGSGAGSLVNYLLGVSGVDPIRHGLLMERFLSPLRTSLPDIDIDVESARRLEVYDAILARYGTQRCAVVSMMDTYKVRHAIRDVGAALGMPPGEIGALAKAFPRVRARNARAVLARLPELRDTALARRALAGEWGCFETFFELVESLDGLPRNIAMHPCGVLLSDVSLLDRTPVQPSALGYPMSQFDKDDVEDLGLLKLDVLGIRMQSAMAHAIELIDRVDGVRVDLDDQTQVPFDDPSTYQLISSGRTLGVFQIESPGQRELVAKSGIDGFEDIIADISLFRPGPVKSDMIRPYLNAKQGWKLPEYLHDDLRPILSSTRGVVVYHEQVIEVLAQLTGCTLAQADEARRALGRPEDVARTRHWFFNRAVDRGYSRDVTTRVWEVLESFGSFGFCKAHAAAFALPTFQSAWLKTHWPAHFIAGVLTHDPGMYPKRMLLDDARQLGIAILPIDVNTSAKTYQVEKVSTGYGIRIALAQLKGINEAELEQILTARRAGSRFSSLSDFWHRAAVSRPVVERLVLAGAFDQIHQIGTEYSRRREQQTRRDLLLQVSELDQLHRASRPRVAAGRGAEPVSSTQLVLDLGTGQTAVPALPEMSAADRVRAELEVLGLDVSQHALDFYAEFLAEFGVTRADQLLQARNRTQLWVAGVKVATQTPPLKSGRRVIFLTVEDSTGPVDATFFEDAQATCASTVFGSWLLLVQGTLRRTGRRGVSLVATGAWDLAQLHSLWRSAGMSAV
ncbi:MAG TPA: DNA polymerase III subunit alpha, partial [Marmoricola sp.]|nr:DNA polymerase III subunit alpha [Marmoricola sp.]